MSSAVGGAAEASATSSPGRSPGRKLNVLMALRAALFAAVGFTITFTAPLHENIAFNRAVFAALCAGLVVLGAVGLAQANRVRQGRGRANRARSDQLAPALLGALALIAGIVTLATSGAATFGLILVVWAAATALIKLITGLRTGHRESITTGALAGILAVLLTLSGNDPVAAIGFLGAYGIVVGVYLAIDVFDQSPATGSVPGNANTTKLKS